MAKQSAVPFMILAAGAAALAMKKKKKKKSGASTPSDSAGGSSDPSSPDFRPNWNEIFRPDTVVLKSSWDQMFNEGQAPNAKMVFNADCTDFAAPVADEEHNQYITMMFHHLVEAGSRDLDEISLAILKDQAPNCPWDDPSMWTELMTGVYGQLRQGVAEYAASFG